LLSNSVTRSFLQCNAGLQSFSAARFVPFRLLLLCPRSSFLFDSSVLFAVVVVLLLLSSYTVDAGEEPVLPPVELTLYLHKLTMSAEFTKKAQEGV
jgi:hypothetical protein